MAEHNNKVGTVNMKTLVMVLVGALGLGGGGSVVGTRLAAPDPASVEKTASDVSAIRTELATLNTTLESFMREVGSSRAPDRAEWERRFAEQQRAIDKLDALADRARKVDDLERRVNALEKR